MHVRYKHCPTLIVIGLLGGILIGVFASYFVERMGRNTEYFDASRDVLLITPREALGLCGLLSVEGDQEFRIQIRNRLNEAVQVYKRYGWKEADELKRCLDQAEALGL